MSRVVDAKSRHAQSTPIAALRDAAARRPKLSIAAALGFALTTTACSPLASQFIDAESGARPSAAAFPQAMAPPKISSQAAAVLRAPPASAADAPGAQHICLDKTFYGTLETKCAWGEGE